MGRRLLVRGSVIMRSMLISEKWMEGMGWHAVGKTSRCLGLYIGLVV